jgi:acyl-CoA dehydrogenase
MTQKVLPALKADPLVEDAAARAFADLGASWFDRGGPAGEDAAARRVKLMQAIVELGFADALPSPDAREHWADAALLIRAQGRAAVPVDMALLLATGDRSASIAYDAATYAAGKSRPTPADPATAMALTLGRCLQLTGAMASALDLSLQYVQDRKQFGRSLSKFQAVQHGLAVAAEEIAASTAITDLVVARLVSQGPGASLSALLDAAALVVAHAVDVVYDHCHQVHGAIGFTREYALHRHSLDLLRWREELLQLRGGELACAERLGGHALAAQSAWRAVTALMNPGGTHG